MWLGYTSCNEIEKCLQFNFIYVEIFKDLKFVKIKVTELFTKKKNNHQYFFCKYLFSTMCHIIKNTETIFGSGQG